MDLVAEEPRSSRCFKEFEERELHSFGELRSVLEEAGAAGWLAAAVGFNPAGTPSGGGRAAP